MSLFLTQPELRELTGFAIKAKQIAQLRTMGIPFRINGCGRPVVTRVAIEGSKESAAPAQTAWIPAVVSGGRR